MSYPTRAEGLVNMNKKNIQSQESKTIGTPKVVVREEIEMSGLVSLFNGISTLFRLFNAKAILLEEQ